MKAALNILVVFALIIVGGITAVLFVGGAGASGATSTGCTAISTAISTAVSTVPDSVGRWAKPQLAIAATIMSVAVAGKYDLRAETIAVMTAMGESSLGDPDHGDAVDNTTIGTFQQGASYGTVADRLDTAKAAAAFLARLVQVPDWETLEPSLATHAVQINQDPLYYAPFWADAQTVVNTLAGAGGACTVSADAQALAKELIVAVDAGKLVGSTPDHIKEIRWIADGQTVPDCGVDVRILQVIVLAVRNFAKVGVSDINRKCTNQIEGAGTASAHYFNGGGHAVDFYILDGSGLTGADKNSLKLISILDPVMPHGADVGQSSCRQSAGISLALTNLVEFDDSCTHLHIDVGHTDGTLTFQTSTPPTTPTP
ncbi:hypothetical protein [Subtercola vilae]|uniref:Uncharacterized protein n=1 Tax=Subtercola vilae TaxID=2056433 RepID=A0A4T2BQ79_9MICO|nr:hypothetical protein [Subtercola vilae]TIH33775.1 hypothetical protein D4765_13915 [Subtercola vilae]